MNVIITGSSGMVGKAVLLECLSHEKVKRILVINRSTITLEHPKLTELLHKDFSDFSAIKNQLNGYDAVFHCMGVSSIGINQEIYTKLTFDITKNLVDNIYSLNTGAVFNYVSGQGTDSSETGRLMWANVKGKTENYVLHKGFKDAYAFRPGVILPEKGVKAKSKWVNGMYYIMKPFYPLLKKLSSVTTSSNIGLAMINSVLKPNTNKILENKDINMLAKN